MFGFSLEGFRRNPFLIPGDEEIHRVDNYQIFFLVQTNCKQAST